MLRALWIVMVASLLTAGCQSGPKDADIRILDRNVLGFTYVVCASKVKWDGVAFTIDGLSIDTGATVEKKFTIGKLDYKPVQVREVNSIALGVDSMFQQMCQSTIALRNNPTALAEYVKGRDVTALKLFDILQKMQTVNQGPGAAEQKVEEQKKLFSEVAPK